MTEPIKKEGLRDFIGACLTTLLCSGANRVLVERSRLISRIWCVQSRQLLAQETCKSHPEAIGGEPQRAFPTGR